MTDHTENPRFFVSALPQICNDCGLDLVNKVANNPGVNLVSHHCPHTGTLANAYTGTLEGLPAILSWDLRGPGLSEEHAMNLLAEMVEQVESLGGDSCTLIDKARLQ